MPRAWSTPSLGPYVRSGLKPPLLQQAAFDDLIFRVDVMRNVASRHMQPTTNETTAAATTTVDTNKQTDATKQPLVENQTGDDGIVANAVEAIANTRKWSSLPALNLVVPHIDCQSNDAKNELVGVEATAVAALVVEDGEKNGCNNNDEGLQEVSRIYFKIFKIDKFQKKF